MGADRLNGLWLTTIGRHRDTGSRSNSPADPPMRKPTSRDWRRDPENPVGAQACCEGAHLLGRQPGPLALARRTERSVPSPLRQAFIRSFQSTVADYRKHLIQASLALLETLHRDGCQHILAGRHPDRPHFDGQHDSWSDTFQALLRVDVDEGSSQSFIYEKMLQQVQKLSYYKLEGDGAVFIFDHENERELYGAYCLFNAGARLDRFELLVMADQKYRSYRGGLGVSDQSIVWIRSEAGAEGCPLSS
jgi:hypothetical protein